MRAIFISYRRHDAEGEAGRLFDDLVREFGDQSMFMDVSTIQAGRDFRKAIDESVATCGVLLAIIGMKPEAEIGRFSPQGFPISTTTLLPRALRAWGRVASDDVNG